MPTGNLRGLMSDPAFDRLSLADQTDVMRRAGAPDEMLSEWVRRNATGPMLSPSSVRAEGFEDTSADVKRILSTYHEPNRARDVLPRLASFAAQGAMAGAVPGTMGTLGAGIRGLKGLSTAGKAATIAKAGGTLVGEAGKFYAADRALALVGVPGEYRAVLLTAMGFTRPGEAARSAAKTAAKTLFRRGAAAEAPAVAATVAREAAPAVAGVPEVEVLKRTATAARQAALARGATAEEAQAAAMEASLNAIRSGSAPAAVPASAPARVAPAAAAAQAAPAAGKTWRETGIAGYYGKGPFPTDAEWAKMGGEKAKRAWLESRGLIPGAATPQDVVAAIKRGATADELEAMFPPGAPWAKAAQASAGAAAKASPGAARAAQHNRLMSFAKEAASKSKLGARIWLELDQSGAPVRVLTPDQAAAAKRAGKGTVWVRNLWNAA